MTSRPFAFRSSDMNNTQLKLWITEPLEQFRHPLKLEFRRLVRHRYRPFVVDPIEEDFLASLRQGSRRHG
jgi:hypothetical protein